MDRIVIIRHAKKISSHDGKTKHGLSIYVTSDVVYDELYNWLTVTCNNLFVTTRNIEYTHTKSFFMIWFDELKYRDLFLLRWT